MYFRRYKEKVIISKEHIDFGFQIPEDEAFKEEDTIYYIDKKQVGTFNRTFCLYNVSLLNLDSESPKMLSIPEYNLDSDLPQWFLEKINQRKVAWVNMAYPNWEDVLVSDKPNKWRINIVGLGDVGGTLLTGLRLLGGKVIDRIGILDIDSKKVDRWLQEANQIIGPNEEDKHPEIVPVEKKELFDCDVFIFSVSTGVPSIDSPPGDVRMAQYKGNSRIIKEYAIAAREKKFKGIFAVLSDPVDLLCRKAFIESNTNKDGVLDYKGLSPDQIRGYGLGVMRARAAYHAKNMKLERDYTKLGRAYGPHGKGLVIANNIEKYDNDISLKLTQKALESNIDVRKTGFKPYIAPALSSGALSILATINGQWHYSSIFIGGIYFGCRNKLIKSGTEIEMQNIPETLMARIKKSYDSLGDIDL